MKLGRIARGGRYCRVVKPDWIDGADTSYSKRFGGRWNPKGLFGALYLNRDLEVASANARAQHRGRAIGLFDLRAGSRPLLQWFDVAAARYVDAVTAQGVAALGFPATFPHATTWHRCQSIARVAYIRRAPGIACRSSAEATAEFWAGEELAIFDTQMMPRTIGKPVPFGRWYPQLKPT